MSSVRGIAATKRAVFSGYGKIKRWFARIGSFFGTHWLLSYLLLIGLGGLGVTVVRLQTLPVDAGPAPRVASTSLAIGIVAALRVGFWSDQITSQILSAQYEVDPDYRLPDFQSSDWAMLVSGLDSGLIDEYVHAVSRAHALAIRTRLLKEQTFYRLSLDRPENDRTVVFLIATEIELIGSLWLPIALLSLLSAAVSRRSSAVA